MIILVASIIFILFFVAFVYAWKKEKKSNQETEYLYASMRTLSNGISDIGNIESTNNDAITSKIEGDYIKLNRLSRIYKYTHEKEYWIEFILENSTIEDVDFVLKKVELYSNNIKIESNLTLLLEKVPEYMAPPYGNNYFNTNSYNNFVLGTRGQKSFILQSRFSLNDNLNTFKDFDYIKIEIAITSLGVELKKHDSSKNFELVESFKNMKFKNIQSIDEKIEWND